MFRESTFGADAKVATSLRVQPKDFKFSERISKHRNIVSLYDLSPCIMLDCYIAPNATVIGEVVIEEGTSIWYGAVIRGDINKVNIGKYCSIGDNTVIHTAGSLPTGIPASVNIGDNVWIQSNCTLYSCDISDTVVIGHKSVILEGARLEHGCAIGPNSVVPPGRIIPANQLWAGNPVEYVRDLGKAELQQIAHTLKQNNTKLREHKFEFLPYNSAYLQKENEPEDLNVSADELRGSFPYTHDAVVAKTSKGEIY
eukprot:CAMPEP_0176425650 /NCGR_PEP_ID=MMETSP0127-20121128/11502_1 /TAXON_ID=938130 /ORGANISM="Platyophrya macrostoma, Strain WH" /LENGTH=254 /DNA_ID=CAMNT_0017806825 /DNA_START=95 /DNA_END=859 /DNA_ORIENTATION=+